MTRPKTSETLRDWLAWVEKTAGGYRPRERRPSAHIGVLRLEDRLAPAFFGGVSVAAGDINGDGFVDIVTAAGPGGGPHVKVFSGETGQEVAGFFAYDPAVTSGVQVAVGDVTGDGHADIVTAPGPAPGLKSKCLTA